MSDKALTEDEQRQVLQMHGWIPIDDLGKGGGARVFKVVSQEAVTRLKDVLITATTHDHANAGTQALALARILGDVADGEQVVFAAGKVASRHNDDRMKREIEILRDVQHPNLIQLLDADTNDPCWYVMPVMRNRTIKDRAALRGDLAAVTRGMLQVAGALAALHEKGIVHRDVKPANIFLADDGEWILGDPGVAYRDDGADETETRPVSKDWFPRWYDDEMGHNSKADLYLLGATSLWTIVGKKPLGGHYVAEPQFRLPELYPGAPGVDRLYALLKSLIRDNPKEVPYADARELVPVLRELLPVVEGQPSLRAEQELARLRSEPTLVFSYHSALTVSGDVDTLKSKAIWIPSHATRLLVWVDGPGEQHVVEIWDDNHQQRLVDGTVEVDVPNGISIPEEVRGCWTMLDVKRRSGLIGSLRVYAHAP